MSEQSQEKSPAMNGKAKMIRMLGVALLSAAVVLASSSPAAAKSKKSSKSTAAAQRKAADAKRKAADAKRKAADAQRKAAEEQAKAWRRVGQSRTVDTRTMPHNRRGGGTIVSFGRSDGGTRFSVNLGGSTQTTRRWIPATYETRIQSVLVEAGDSRAFNRATEDFAATIAQVNGETPVSSPSLAHLRFWTSADGVLAATTTFFQDSHGKLEDLYGELGADVKLRSWLATGTIGIASLLALLVLRALMRAGLKGKLRQARQDLAEARSQDEQPRSRSMSSSPLSPSTKGSGYAGATSQTESYHG